MSDQILVTIECSGQASKCQLPDCYRGLQLQGKTIATLAKGGINNNKKEVVQL
jgi:hypothetical protein